MSDWKNALGALLESGSLPEGEEMPQPVAPQSEEKAVLRVVVDKKGRKGKVATVIEGFGKEDVENTADLASELKKELGLGGSWCPGEILLQGDCKAKVEAALRRRGYRLK